MNSLKILLISLVAFLTMAPSANAQEASSATFLISGKEYLLETLVTGLEVPCAIEFEPSGTILIAERTGSVRAINLQSREQALLLNLPLNTSFGDLGILGMALHPDYASNNQIYICHTYLDELDAKARVVRYVKTADGLVEPETIIDDIPSSRFNVGGNIGFGPDNKLYILTGDTLKKHLAQYPGSLAGKVLRINDDGSIPEDNPFINQAGALKAIWSVGFRNPQGLTWNKQTGEMYVADNGSEGFDGSYARDEINIVNKGKNYGWPGAVKTTSLESLVEPFYSLDSISEPGSVLYYDSDRMPDLKGSLFLASLKQARLIRYKLKNGRVVQEEHLLRRIFGRIRVLKIGPEGAIYLANSNNDGRGIPHPNDDRLFRIIPKSN